MWQTFFVTAIEKQYPQIRMDQIPWKFDDGKYFFDEGHWDERQFGKIDLSALEIKAKALFEESQKITRDDVNKEILENLKLIWGGDSETRVAQKHQNGVGIMTRLLNKEGSDQTPLTSAEMTIKDGIKGQLEAHEAVLNEGRRIKALSPIPADYKALIEAAMTA